jgi:transcription elongation factor GreA
MSRNLDVPSVIYCSEQGFKKLKRKREKVYAEYLDICEQRTVAHELSGDGWHDNPHFNYLQQVEANYTWKIRELDKLIENATVYNVSSFQRPTAKIKLGSIVKVKLLEDEEDIKVYEIVGYEESQIQNNKISYTSPLAKALMTTKSSYAKIPSLNKEYEILDLYASPEDLEDEEQLIYFGGIRSVSEQTFLKLNQQVSLTYQEWKMSYADLYPLINEDNFDLYIKDLQKRLTHLKIYQLTDIRTVHRIDLGAFIQVKVIDEYNIESQDFYEIVGYEEDELSYQISINSDFGYALAQYDHSRPNETIYYDNCKYQILDFFDSATSFHKARNEKRPK